MVVLYYTEQFPLVLGGPSDVIEVEETHIFTRKYHRGRVLVSQTVRGVGVICRITKRVALRIVRKRDAASLTKSVTANISPGSTIITDKSEFKTRLKITILKI
jgi:hypothetical protein